MCDGGGLVYAGTVGSGFDAREQAEIRARLRKLNLRTVPRRLEKLGEDPLLPVLELRPDLMTALAKLAELL